MALCDHVLVGESAVHAIACEATFAQRPAFGAPTHAPAGNSTWRKRSSFEAPNLRQADLSDRQWAEDRQKKASPSHCQSGPNQAATVRDPSLNQSQKNWAGYKSPAGCLSP